MKQEYILILLDLIERGMISSITVSKTMVVVRIKNNRPAVVVCGGYFY